ncbi:hypothetical protein ES702_03157 [subsurface metagenome]
MKKHKLGRTKSHKDLMLRNLATSVVLYEKIKTTPAKAKAVRPLVEKMINLGKRKDFSAQKKLYSFFPDKNAVKKILEDLIPKLKDRKSGYLRITRLGFRAGDAAPQVLVELLLPEPKISKKPKIEPEVRVKTKIRKKEEKTMPVLDSVSGQTNRQKMSEKEEVKEEKEKVQAKKGWLDKVKDVKIPKISKAAKKIITKRTTQK